LSFEHIKFNCIFATQIFNLKQKMKKFIVILSVTVASFPLFGQDISGDWNGLARFKNEILKIVFHIQKTDSGYMATWDSPYQASYGLAIDTTVFENGQLTFICNKSRFTYKGILNKKGEIDGIFNQGEQISLCLSQKEITRPQDPKKPYPYIEEEVKFDNPAAPGVTLAGTFTLPKKHKRQCPAVILVSGSGQQNRDEELFGHKPFLVIADYLTRRGIAVLRYDDRGVFGSTGNPDTCTAYDFSLDAEAAFNYLKNRKEINPQQIGIIGHSEGGAIAPMVVARNKEVAFIVLLAAPGVRGDSLMYLQRRLMMQLLKFSQRQIDAILTYRSKHDSLIVHIDNLEQRNEELADFFTGIADKQMPKATQEEKNKMIERELQIVTSQSYQYLVRYNPAIALSRVQCFVLALNGDKDFQVSATENLNGIQQALLGGNNRQATIQKLPDLNHLFQISKTGLSSEYPQIEETFSPKVLKIMEKWIKRVTK
jgi:pimeloyl-ACP methyl ester carboxylesterase